MHLKSIILFPETYPTTEHYPFNLSVLRKTRSVALSSPVTFFVGENGTGKSTLLEALAVRCGIHIWRGLERSRYEINAYEGELYKYIAVEWTDGIVPGSFFASEIFRNFAESLDTWAAADPGILKYFGGKSPNPTANRSCHFSGLAFRSKGSIYWTNLRRPSRQKPSCGSSRY